jgi:hypothetical protein
MNAQNGPSERDERQNFDVYAAMSPAELRAAASHARQTALAHVREMGRLQGLADECMNHADALTDRAAELEAKEAAATSQDEQA